MQKKSKRHFKVRRNAFSPVAGASPGDLKIQEGSLKPKIRIFSYTESYFKEEKAEHFTGLMSCLVDKKCKYWVDIAGLGDIKLIEAIQDNFHINKLVLEDILNTFQRPKLDEYDDYLFAVSRMMFLNKELQLENNQVSYILTPNILFTFQEDYNDCFEPVVARLRGGKGSIRTAGPAYMMYALMDVIVDNYFGLINSFGDNLEEIESRLYDKPDKSVMYETQAIKRAMIAIRRAAWPERDKLNDMIRSTSPLITEETKLYIKDAYDHCIQIIDLIESYKEISSSLIEVYLSVVSNRMNEVMKVLTVISSIFIPLTFIAGVYGMNFAYQDPKTGKVLPHNMPELYAANGYVYTMVIMAVIAAIQLVLFWRKGWLK